MIDAQLIDDLVSKISDVVPPGIKEIEMEVKKQIKAIIESSIAKMDLVSREEFDIQVKVLAKTREKIDKLERQLLEMEK